MYELSPTVRALYVAGAIAAMRRRYPGLTWQDAQMINEGPGWDYELPWYEQHWLSGPLPPMLVHGERLERLALMHAWQLARERTYH
jgi:hypothetical protein